ncbi:MAG: S24/S26 family peptidase [Oscillospiraceae bacterium]|nr:S24/S26 family peptidase [Oscillospiraceae bacterium]
MNEQLSAEQVLKEKGFFVTTTSGVSMLPLFSDRRDRIVIRPVADRLKKYDVPLYRRGESLVLHRVIGVRENHYIIRGDNCIERETVKDEQIVGVLCEFYRKDKHYTVNDFSYRLYSRLWVFISPALIAFKKARSFLSRIYHKIIKK